MQLFTESHDDMAVSVEQVSSLNKKLEKLDLEKREHYSENLRLKQELNKNAKNLEVLKKNLSKMPTLEAERDDLRDNVNKLKIKIETLLATQGKLDEQEQEINKLKIECKTLQRSNVTCQVSTKKKIGLKIPVFWEFFQKVLITFYRYTYSPLPNSSAGPNKHA